MGRLDTIIFSEATCLFKTFIQAGFECSTHKLRDGTRLDLIQSTQHDRFARKDYARLKEFGIKTIRIGAQWHLIEGSPASYNFQSLDTILNAAADCGMEVILDLLHFGWPDHIQIFADDFTERFSSFTRAVIKYLRSRTDACRFIASVNEVSYFSWAGGDVAAINPYAINRGHELKHILIRAAVASSEILLNELPNVRLVSPEPAIHIVGNPAIEGDEAEAAAYTDAMFQAWDMLSGRLEPELGGRPEYLDIVGVNFYQRNQWIHNTMTPVSRDDPRYRHFSDILEEIWLRYSRPLFVSETGTEDDGRADWFNYICSQVSFALSRGIPVHGICLYPILNHPGWADNRHCHNGLFDYPDASGNRQVYHPLAAAIYEQQQLFRTFNKEMTSKTRDVICLSHLRWGFVFQRPQHLMSRFAKAGRVFFWEEPILEDGEPHVRSSTCPVTGVNVETPVLPHGLSREQSVQLQKELLTRLLEQNQMTDYIAWYYTPMAREFTTDLKPAVTVYDCMDELSAFAGAPREMRENEQALFRQADMVFTGGASLYKSKQMNHHSVHLFPSSIDFAHFSRARSITSEPADQVSISHPRLGYAGVIDERMDLALIKELAAARPDWQVVMVGPIVKIDPDLLPKADNIHYLGMKQYADLPSYLSGWDIALLPFAQNDSTRFISPTKTPEYLAAGLPVVSSPIQDVVHPYGDSGFVQIASSAQEFVEKVDQLLLNPLPEELRRKIDEFLAGSSWDQTWTRMNQLIEEFIEKAAGNARPPMGSVDARSDTADKDSVYV